MPGHVVVTEPFAQSVRIELDGAVLAESDDVVALHETGLPTRYYFPRAHVRTERLTASESHTQCPWKGTASYFDLGDLRDFVWFYPEPLEAVADIAGRLAFYNHLVDVFVDGKREA